MSPLVVAVVGASGETGGSIVNALLETPDNFEVRALVRPASIGKPIIQSFQNRGVKIVPADISSTSEAELTELLEGVDTVITAFDAFNLKQQIPLIHASSVAGVKRFIPTFFGTPAPRGIMSFRDQKEEILDYVNQAYLGYTAIDVGWWYQLVVPRLPSGRTNHAVALPDDLFPSNAIFGTGDVKIGFTDLSDIGRYVARIIADPRTLNKKVYVHGELHTQREAIALVEKLSGEKVKTEHISEAKILSAIAEAKKIGESAFFQRVGNEYYHSWGVRGDNTPEHAVYLGYLDGKELYPDLKAKSLEAFLREVLDENYEKPYRGRFN